VRAWLGLETMAWAWLHLAEASGIPSSNPSLEQAKPGQAHWREPWLGSRNLQPVRDVLYVLRVVLRNLLSSDY
jgi:hypothetical protein